jgi:N,N'-diacetyllegionaminate synthase
MHKTIIIAEAGVNHNGSLKIAKELIDAAATAGADYVKFQTFITENVISKNAQKAEYQVENTVEKNETQFEMVKKLELTPQMHFQLIEHSNSKGIKFLSTAFDLDSIDLLVKLKVPFFKIPSGEITNYPYLIKVAKNFEKIIMSTGMADMQEVKDCLDILTSNGVKMENITILHCNTEYPTPMEDVNLKAMISIGEKLGVNVGYSDHTLGIEVPIAAVAMGAKVIEKHFTLDNKLPGPDHRASLEPNALNDMVSAIRNIELAISGDGVKQPSKSEEKNRAIVRKSIHLKNDIKKEQIIDEKDLCVLRPSYGITPMSWLDVIGKKANKDLYAGEFIKWEDIYE